MRENKYLFRLFPWHLHDKRGDDASIVFKWMHISSNKQSIDTVGEYHEQPSYDLEAMTYYYIALDILHIYASHPFFEIPCWSALFKVLTRNVRASYKDGSSSVSINCSITSLSCTTTLKSLSIDDFNKRLRILIRVRLSVKLSIHSSTS